MKIDLDEKKIEIDASEFVLVYTLRTEIADHFEHLPSFVMEWSENWRFFF